MDLLVLSDVSAAIVAAVWSSSFSMGKIPQNAMRALAVSIVSRLLSQNTSMIPISDGTKNQLYVFALGALNGAYMEKGHFVKYGLIQSSQDLLGTELLRIFNQSPEMTLFSTAGGTAINRV
jgi:hypothetical protein